ncbi:uncharacterized protein BYT42DRAFT_551208 [Radiomyces spectabilis]|uniref:uncharacterized protein n=1 Tax=Radiomyces spectabilis TaxID=64574 RepID=UPI00221E5F0F|nr:uncharacterized protein BYT42DRAFT_551208 [Radiomyces spectabilis]KAI8393495.1 hypothetical protein BYT42DRAFT_551208 [Radiomyces spectabilis]
MISTLPAEIVWQIISYLSLKDISLLRLSSKRLRTFCDHPAVWRDLQLNPSMLSSASTCHKTCTLWTLADLQAIVGPHVSHIRSIQIWGVRDSIVRYLLANCLQLQELTLCGWTTLSDHAFKTADHPLKLERLELIGAANQTNYTSIDASTLGKLLTHCTELSELLLSCQIHIHAQALLKELESSPPKKLRSLTLATRRTWSSQHITELLALCPAIQQVGLLPAAAAGFNLESEQKLNVGNWIADKTQVAIDHSVIHQQEDEPIPSEGIIIYRT